VIEGGRFPAIDGVAGTTRVAKTSVMVVIFLMAGETIDRCPFEYVIDMATQAVGRCVFASQFEGGQIMVIR